MTFATPLRPFFFYCLQSPINPCHCFAIAVLRRGALWCATARRGVVCYDVLRRAVPHVSPLDPACMASLSPVFYILVMQWRAELCSQQQKVTSPNEGSAPPLSHVTLGHSWVPRSFSIDSFNVLHLDPREEPCGPWSERQWWLHLSASPDGSRRDEARQLIQRGTRQRCGRI